MSDGFLVERFDPEQENNKENDQEKVNIRIWKIREF